MSTLSSQRRLSVPTPVRFAILGFGLHAIKRLVPAFAAAEHAQLVGLWRRDQAAARKNAADFNLPHAFATREALCSSPVVDAIFITSPDALHHDDVLLAAAHGKAILCEKPLAMNAAEALAMQHAAERAGVLLGVAQNMRWNRVLIEMRDRLAAGQIGTPQLARAQFCYNGTRSPRRWIADGALACGGPIGDVGVHCLDALRFVLDRDITSLQTLALGDPSYHQLEAIASLQGVAPPRPGLPVGNLTVGNLAGGCLVNVTVSALAAYRTQLEILGSDGALLCENALTTDQPVTLELRRGGKLEEQRTIDNAGSFSRMLDSFADAVQGGAPFPSTAASGVTNMHLLDAAYRGASSGHTEPVESTAAAPIAALLDL